MNETNIQRANAILWSAALALTFFWVLNLFKESYAGVKSFLNFYPSVGPLLGLFIFSGLLYLIAFFVFSLLKLNSQKAAFWMLLVSSVVFFLMVFPPVYEPIVHILAGK